MKYVWPTLLIFLLFPTVFASEGIRNYDTAPFEFLDVVENQSGKPCLNCDCNLSIFNSSFGLIATYKLTRNTDGIYNVTIYNITPNKFNEYYPVVLVCNASSFYGTSTINGIRVGGSMNDLIGYMLAPIAMAAISAFLAFKWNNTHVMLRWFFSLFSILCFMAFAFLGMLGADVSGYTSISQFFEILLEVTGAIFVFVMFYVFSIFIKFTKQDEKIREANN